MVGAVIAERCPWCGCQHVAGHVCACQRATGPLVVRNERPVAAFLVTGSRHLTGGLVANTLERLYQLHFGGIPRPTIALLHGAGEGADTLADEWARGQRIRPFRFPADWQVYGDAAGPRRNGEMVKAATQLVEAGTDVVGVAFWDGRIKGCGTFDCMQKMTRVGLLYVVQPVKMKART